MQLKKFSLISPVVESGTVLKALETEPLPFLDKASNGNLEQLQLYLEVESFEGEYFFGTKLVPIQF